LLRTKLKPTFHEPQAFYQTEQWAHNWSNFCSIFDVLLR